MIRQVCMSRMVPPRSISGTGPPVLASAEVRTPDWFANVKVHHVPFTLIAYILLTVSSEFQTHPSLMDRQVSLDAMRLLRLNVALSASLQQARQAAAAMLTPSAIEVPRRMPNHTSSVGSFNQWSFMASSPSVMLDPSTIRDSIATSSYSLWTPPVMGVQTRRVESSSTVGAALRNNGNPVIQYLQQQQALNRQGARRHNKRGSNHNVSTHS
jgi:hypothetical protein